MPFRTPITTVGRPIFSKKKKLNSLVGKPIKVVKNLTPTQDEIDRLHEEYCTQLIQLFDTHKTKYDIPEKAKLNIY